MSDENYQVVKENVHSETDANALANAMDEKLVEESKVQEDTGSLGAEGIAQAEESQQESPQNDQFSSKFAALSRKEKDIRHREAQLEQRLAEFEERFNQMQQKQEEPKEEPKQELPLEYRLKKDPLSTLEEMGLSYDVLTKLALNEGEMPPDMQMKLMREELERDYKSKFEELENKILEKEKAEEEQKYQQVIDSFKSQINDFVNKDESYELIKANEAEDLVYEVIEEHFNETGRILDTKEAADQVEQYLEEELRTVLKKSKKLGATMTPQEAKESLRQATPTLSNSQSAKGVSSADTKPLSPEESKAKAAQMIRWID